MERWERYLSFKGRAARLSYWRVSFVASLLLIVPIMIAVFAVMAVGPSASVLAVLCLPFFVAMLAVGVRRLHDRGKSGWWLILFWLVPTLLSGWVETQGEATDDPVVIFTSLASLALSVWSLVEIGFLKGTPGPNRYGHDPTQPEPAEAFS